MTIIDDSNLQITPSQVFEQRRLLIKQLILAGLLPSTLLHPKAGAAESLMGQITPEKLVSSYNNYYEFTSNKDMVKHLSRELITEGWQLRVDGLVAKPMTFELTHLQELRTIIRVYRFRCVEGWSAVIPWHGFELNGLLKRVEPLANAKFVKFTGHLDPIVMIGQRDDKLPWPYVEGLRLDEAMHPLTLIATGMYDKPLPNQNGAPLRLVVPWKYGYKSIKAITRITLMEEQPISSWQQSVPSEYGFYGNVNPSVAHPRWSQRREVRLGEIKKRKTELLNGYAAELQALYQNDSLNELF